MTGYKADMVGATKLDAPLLKTPVAVQAVTRQTMDDQQAISVQDAIIGNVSSVAPAPGGISYWQTLTIRGFTTTSVSGYGMSQTYRNGLMQPFVINPNTSNVQSMEVVKGPGAVLYGRVEPGGFLDMIIKRPLETPYYSVEEKIGSYGLTRTTVDATGPLTADKTWLYRLNGQFLHSGSFVDYVTNQDGFGSGTITYRPDTRFKFNLDLEYQDSIGVDNAANFPAIGNRPANIPISRYLEDPTTTVNNPDHYIRRFVGFDWEYKLDEQWTIVNRFAYANSRYLATGEFLNCMYNPPYPTGCAGASAVGDGYNSVIVGHNVLRSISGSLDLKGKFDTGFLHHETMFGTDHLSSSSANNAYYIFKSQPFWSSLPLFNIYNPYYAGTGLWGQLSPSAGFALIKKQEWQGIYAQDLISFYDDKIHLLLGGRYDFASATSSTQFSSSSLINNALDLANFKAVRITDHAFSPRIGLVVQPLPWLSFYGNYTESFSLNNGLNSVTLAPLGPQKATQWEGGVKAEFFDKRLSATFAYYDIKKTNVAQKSVVAPSGVYDLLDAESKGVEMDITGRVDDNWSIIANYAHTEARVTKGEAFNPADPLDLSKEAPVAGHRLPGVPDNMGAVWIKYDADGALAGLSAGAGVQRVGAAQGDPANSFQMPAYTILNAMLGYRFAIGSTHVTAQINVNNITNETYFYGATSFTNRYSMTPGTPRNVLGSLRVEF
ncbi:iron complex outermembrane receptor protein [Methylosinus sp. sav-2]|uniref:TonB-dependent siderophore receptor n=1 Tax=Methylosinus sp. sav-2 TaxID=2485168 RepID=UPI0006901816|nr:TonB-dependent siderophore receptor [Methylosinus sp. sav-2]TDX62101.1 iron complex outermembrane receptor protein [Methylosinus sp. sav-2]